MKEGLDEEPKRSGSFCTMNVEISLEEIKEPHGRKLHGQDKSEAKPNTHEAQKEDRHEERIGMNERSWRKPMFGADHGMQMKRPRREDVCYIHPARSSVDELEKVNKVGQHA